MGSASGPIYQTLVNLEERKPGRYQLHYNGRDESGLIDFKAYGPLHFCVDTMPKPRKDIELLTTVTRTPKNKQRLPTKPLLKGIIDITEKPLSLTVDINKSDRQWFLKTDVETMVFLDNRLIRLKKTKTLPHTVRLKPKDIPAGKHLLSLNVWSSDHSSVACKNLLILSKAKKEAKPVKATDKAEITGKLAYCQHNGEFWQICSSDLDGSNPRQLTKTSVDKRYPRFSPSGKEIAYVTNDGELWIMDIDGGNNHRIPLNIHASQPKWHPDGKRLTFVSYQDLYHGGTELWEVNLKTLKLKKIINRPWMQYDPCYSSGGENILFTDGPELYAQDIHKLDFKTGDVTQLTDNGPYHYDMQPAYSADGEKIVYSSNQGGNYDIWIMDKFGQNPKNLTKNKAYDMMPQISADKKSIFFLSDRSGIFQIWSMDIKGAGLRQITDNKKEKQDLALYSQTSAS